NPVAGGEKNSPGSVGYQAAAGLPDPGLVVGDAGLIGPQRARVGRDVEAKHVARVGLHVAVRTKSPVDMSVCQQQTGPGELVLRAELDIRVVARGAADWLFQADTAGVGVDAE